MDANNHGIEAGPVLNENEPQINADERRYFSASEFSKIIHRKVGHELRFINEHEKASVTDFFIPGRKAAQREPPCPLCSLWLNLFSAPAHGRAPQQPGGWEVVECVF